VKRRHPAARDGGIGVAAVPDLCLRLQRAAVCGAGAWWPGNGGAGARRA